MYRYLTLMFGHQTIAQNYIELFTYRLYTMDFEGFTFVGFSTWERKTEKSSVLFSFSLEPPPNRIYGCCWSFTTFFHLVEENFVQLLIYFPSFRIPFCFNNFIDLLITSHSRVAPHTKHTQFILDSRKLFSLSLGEEKLSCDEAKKNYSNFLLLLTVQFNMNNFTVL